jgi:hypothetical protein
MWTALIPTSLRALQTSTAASIAIKKLVNKSHKPIYASKQSLLNCKIDRSNYIQKLKEYP